MSDYTVRILEASEEQEWDNLVVQSPQGTIYSKAFWFRLISRVYGLNYCLYGCFKGDELVGGAGIFHSTKYGRKFAHKPPLTPYCGLIIKRAPANRTGGVAEALIPCLEKNYGYIKLAHHWSLKDIRPFTWAGWNPKVIYTYLISLESEDAIWQAFDHQIKKQVKKGIRQGFTVYRSEEPGEEERAVFYELLTKTFAKQNLPSPISPDKYISLMEALTGRARLYLAGDGERILAGRIILLDKTGPQDWLAGSDPNYLSTGATSFLFWQILRDLALDYNAIDLNGANIKSIARFKRNLGGKLQPYFTTGIIKSSLLKSLKIAKELPRIWS